MSYRNDLAEEWRPIVEKYDMQVVRVEDWIVEYKFKDCFIRLIYDYRDWSCCFLLKNAICKEIEIDHFLMRKIFNEDLDFGKMAPGEFVEQSCMFFNKNMPGICDDQFIEMLETLVDERNAELARKRRIPDCIKMANDAWSNLEYEFFLSLIKGVEESALSPSMKWKVKFARKHVSQSDNGNAH